MKKFFFIFLILIFLLMVFLINRRENIHSVEKTFLYFDTFVRLKFYPEKGLDIEGIVEKLRAELGRIDSLYGYGEGSLTNELTKNWEGMKITKEEGFILKKSQYVSGITDGAFDITVGLLENIWGFREDKPHLPEKEEIMKSLSRIGYKDIMLADSSVSFKKKGMVIDLGGISKGYAVDRVVEILMGEGVKAGIVDAGGDIKVFGKKPGGRKWSIGIRDPERKGAIIKSLFINEGAVATSGNYERFFIKDGKKYHHILDPRTGFPANRCVSVTVVAKDAILADALATGIFVLGPNKGMSLIEKLPDVEGVIMYKKGGKLKIIKSKGLSFQ